MDIIICEDNIEQLQQLQQILEAIANQQVKILLASTKAEKIVDLIQTHGYEPGALFILDIRLAKSRLNGLQLAQMIRQTDAISTIVFITTHSELAYLTFTYKVEALDYILKDNPLIIKTKLISCLQQALIKQKSVKPNPINGYLTFKVGPKLVKIAEDDFIYAETSTNKHRIIIHTFNQQLEIYGSLIQLEKMSSQIVRCHHSYLVNWQQIKLLDLNHMRLTLNNSNYCPVSRKYLVDMKNILKNN